MSVEGDVHSVIVIANGAERDEVIAAIGEHFGMEISGGLIAAGAVYGKFSGSLGTVLTPILLPNGYAIVYRDTRPTRISILNHNPIRRPYVMKRSIDPSSF